MPAASLYYTTWYLCKKDFCKKERQETNENFDEVSEREEGARPVWAFEVVFLIIGNLVSKSQKGLY